MDSCLKLEMNLHVFKLTVGVKSSSRRGNNTLPFYCKCFLFFFVPTKLSSILMRASNSCSPICHLGCVEDPSPAGSGTRGRHLYFPGSSITRLSGPPVLASVRTWKKEKGYRKTNPRQVQKTEGEKNVDMRTYTNQHNTHRHPHEQREHILRCGETSDKDNRYEKCRQTL